MTTTPYQCGTCNHMFFYHRESKEWQRLNTRRKQNLTGCTYPGCTCAAANTNHVKEEDMTTPTSAPTPVTTCQQLVRIDSWHDRVCGRPIKKNELCGIHAAAAERRSKSKDDRLDKRKRGQAAADLLAAKIGMAVHYHGFGGDDYFTVQTASVYTLLEEDK